MELEFNYTISQSEIFLKYFIVFETSCARFAWGANARGRLLRGNVPDITIHYPCCNALGVEPQGLGELSISISHEHRSTRLCWLVHNLMFNSYDVNWFFDQLIIEYSIVLKIIHNHII